MTWRWHAADGVIAGRPAQLEVGGTGRAASEGGRPADAAHPARKRQKKLAENSEGG